MYSIYGLQFTAEGTERYCGEDCAETVRLSVMDKLCDVYEANQFKLAKSEQQFLKLTHGAYIYTLNVLNGGDILLSQFGMDEAMLCFAFVEDKRVKS